MLERQKRLGGPSFMVGSCGEDGFPPARERQKRQEKTKLRIGRPDNDLIHALSYVAEVVAVAAGWPTIYGGFLCHPSYCRT